MHNPELLGNHWKSGDGLAVALLSGDESFAESLEYRKNLAALQEVWTEQWEFVQLAMASNINLICGSRSIDIEWLWPFECNHRTLLRKEDASGTVLGVGRRLFTPLRDMTRGPLSVIDERVYELTKKNQTCHQICFLLDSLLTPVHTFMQH